MYMRMARRPGTDIESRALSSIAIGENVAQRGDGRMIHRNLSRRLKRLEQFMMPTIVRKVWQVVILHPDGRREEVMEIVWPSPQPPDTFSVNPPLGVATDNLNYLAS